MQKVFLSVLVFFVLLGCAQTNDTKDVVEKTSEDNMEKQIAMEKSDDEVDNSSVDLPVCDMTFDGAEDLDGYEGADVYTCGEYFRVSPSQMADAANIYYSKDGAEVGFCGGMPGPDGNHGDTEFCDVVCESTPTCIFP